MSNYSVQNDKNLQYYVRFMYKGNDDEDTIHRDAHPTMDDNYYWVNDGTGPKNTFLLMPAEQDSSNRIWYYVFTTSPDSNDCWEVHDKKGDKLEDHTFTGKNDQKFCFEDAGDGMIHILNKGTGMYLYRSDDEYEGHNPIRQDKGADSDKHKFKLIFDKMVYMPNTEGATTTDENELYNITLLGPVPVPTAYQEVPDPPPKVLIGETLIPFFNVSSDPDMIGDNLRDWQVMNRPYYRLRREQQIQVGQVHNLASGASETWSWEVSYGMSDTETDTFVKKTSLQAGFTQNKTAGLQFMGISATNSRGFSLQWELDLTVTVSEALTYTGTLTETDTFNLDPKGQQITYIVWQACDIWTLYYDDYINKTNNDNNSDVWTLSSDRTFSSEFSSA
jgi:hypothetical protein